MNWILWLERNVTWDLRRRKLYKTPTTWFQYCRVIVIICALWLFFWWGHTLFPPFREFIGLKPGPLDTEGKIRWRRMCGSGVCCSAFYCQTRGFIYNLRALRYVGAPTLHNYLDALGINSEISIVRRPPELEDPFIGGYSGGAPLELPPQYVGRVSGPPHPPSSDIYGARANKTLPITLAKNSTE